MHCLDKEQHGAGRRSNKKPSNKKLLQSADVQVHFQPDLELILASDASDYGIGAVLSHRMADGDESPIGYVSIAKSSRTQILHH